MSDPAAALAPFNVPRETLERLESFVAFLGDESERQNLVSRSSLAEVWTRHIADSAQLLRFAPEGAERWLDLGAGAGFPGLIVAALGSLHVTLVEARKLRVDFLRRAVDRLDLSGRVEVVCGRAETVDARRFDVISARAFAPLDKLLTIGSRFSNSGTVWVLPKGRNAKSELDAARASWQGDFRLEPSLTDADAAIVVAREVRRKGRGNRTR